TQNSKKAKSEFRPLGDPGDSRTLWSISGRRPGPGQNEIITTQNALSVSTGLFSPARPCTANGSNDKARHAISGSEVRLLLIGLLVRSAKGSFAKARATAADSWRFNQWRGGRS